MKKYFTGVLFFIIGTSSLYSQVGINTESPEGVLHIKSNPSSENNGVLIDSDGNEGIIIAIDDDRHPSASVSLGASNKAFVPNCVALTDARGTATGVNNPIKNPVDGMVVYNTSRSGAAPNNVIPGLYVYNASQNRWIYCIIESSTNKEFQRLTLSSPLTLPTVSSYSDIESYAVLNLIDGASMQTDFIEVKSEAAFALSINLSGTITGTPRSDYQRMGIYVAAVLLNNDGSKTILDIAEINPAAFNGSNRKVTYPLVLGFNAKRGNRISILISSYSGPTWTLLPNETSVVFWKI